MNRKSAVLLASGGLDSTTLAYDLESQGFICHPLFVDYGQHCARTEFETLQELVPAPQKDRLRSIRLEGIYELSKSRLITPANLWEEEIDADDLYLPYRSLLILSVGASYAQSIGVSHLFAGFINSNHAHEIDCSATFFEALESVLVGYGGVSLNLPYRDLSKFEVAKRGWDLKVPVASTYSCQASPHLPCGACPNCVDRLDALEKLKSLS